VREPEFLSWVWKNVVKLPQNQSICSSRLSFPFTQIASLHPASTVTTQQSIRKTIPIKDGVPTIPPELLDEIFTDESPVLTTPLNPPGTIPPPPSYENEAPISFSSDTLFDLPPPE